MSGVIELLAGGFIAALAVRIGKRIVNRSADWTWDSTGLIVKQWRERLLTSEKWMKRWFRAKYPWNLERRETAEFAWGWENLE